MMAFYDDWFSGDWFSGDSGTTSAVVDDVNGQEALGQSIVEAAIHRQSQADLAAANEQAANSFQDYYDSATAGPDYDPLSADPYAGVTQETLGRAIVQQAQAPHLVDDSPLSFLKSADISAWSAVASQVKGLVNPINAEQPISGVPRQVFSNRPGNGQGFQIAPARFGSPAGAPGGGPAPMLILGLLVVGVYVASK